MTSWQGFCRVDLQYVGLEKANASSNVQETILQMLDTAVSESIHPASWEMQKQSLSINRNSSKNISNPLKQELPQVGV